MKEVLDKISPYNIFNYLLPGVLFIAISESFTKFSFVQGDIFIKVFVAYFIGLIISRFGSLILEPFLRKVTFLSFVDYSIYISATKKDQKIDVLSEQNNMYRSICSMFILVILLMVAEVVMDRYPSLLLTGPYVLVVMLLGMFLSAYKKQTAYIVKRIKTNGN